MSYVLTHILYIHLKSNLLVLLIIIITANTLEIIINLISKLLETVLYH